MYIHPRSTGWPVVSSPEAFLVTSQCDDTSGVAQGSEHDHQGEYNDDSCFQYRPIGNDVPHLGCGSRGVSRGLASTMRGM